VNKMRTRPRRARRVKELKVPLFQGERIQDGQGREAVCFTTPCGVRAIVATEIPPAALAKMINKLQRKIRRRSQIRTDPKN